jgi:hypothetical protein
MNQLKELEKLNVRRSKLIDKLSKELKKIIKANQTEIYDDVSEVLEDLILDNGNIKFTATNLSITTKAQRAVDDYNKKNRSKLIRFIISFANQIIKVSNEIFALAATKLSKDVRDRATNLLFRSLGYNVNTKTLTKNGYLDNLTNNSALKQRISQGLTQAVSGNVGARTFKKQFRQDFLGKNGLGFVESQFRTFTNDFLASVDSSISKQYADELELEYFIYSGDVIKTTRPQCKARVGIIYSRAFVESEGWDNLIFKGKIPNHQFFLHRFGYGCRHSISFLSLETKNLLEASGVKVNTYN